MVLGLIISNGISLMKFSIFKEPPTKAKVAKSSVNIVAVGTNQLPISKTKYGITGSTCKAYLRWLAKF